MDKTNLVSLRMVCVLAVVASTAANATGRIISPPVSSLMSEQRIPSASKQTMDLAQRIQDDLDDIYPANTATPNPGPPESIPLEIFLDMAVEENDESSGASGSDVSDDEDESIEV